MRTTSLTSRAFNQDSGQAKKAALDGPVVITDRGCPTHVLLSIEEYNRLTKGEKSLDALLFSPEAAAIDFEPPRLGEEAVRSSELV